MGKIAAGVFTQPYCTQLVLTALEKACEVGILDEPSITQQTLQNFLSGFGRTFYRVEDQKNEKIRLKKSGEVIAGVLSTEDGGINIVPFRRGEKTWSLEWI